MMLLKQKIIKDKFYCVNNSNIEHIIYSNGNVVFIDIFTVVGVKNLYSLISDLVSLISDLVSLISDLVVYRRPRKCSPLLQVDRQLIYNRQQWGRKI